MLLCNCVHSVKCVDSVKLFMRLLKIIYTDVTVTEDTMVRPSLRGKSLFRESEESYEST